MIRGKFDAVANFLCTSSNRWETLPWKHLQRNVFKLQKRIYRASCRDDVRTVRRLQRLLVQSRAARVLAVVGAEAVEGLTPAEQFYALAA
jgi:N-terminal domain of reverse transcriptase